MVILQIDATFGLGSTGNIALDLHRQVIQRGWKSYAASPVVRADLADDPDIYRIGNVLDHKIHAFLSRLYGKASLPNGKLN